jgi:hypothetical protein
MRRLRSDQIENEEGMVSRRRVIVGALKVAGGSAGALALTSTPEIARLAVAQDDQNKKDGKDRKGEGGGGQGGQATALPTTGVGIDGNANGQVGLMSMVAISAAAGAVFMRRRAGARQPTNV